MKFTTALGILLIIFVVSGTAVATQVADSQVGLDLAERVRGALRPGRVTIKGQIAALPDDSPFVGTWTIRDRTDATSQVEVTADTKIRPPSVEPTVGAAVHVVARREATEPGADSDGALVATQVIVKEDSIQVEGREDVKVEVGGDIEGSLPPAVETEVPSTPIPLPTDTPVPSPTPVPTATPMPTPPPAPTDTPAPEVVEFTGVVEAIGLNHVVINGTTVFLDANTRVEIAVQLNATVQVRAVRRADGSLLTREIRL